MSNPLCHQISHQISHCVQEVIQLRECIIQSRWFVFIGGADEFRLFGGSETRLQKVGQENNALHSVARSRTKTGSGQKMAGDFPVPSRRLSLSKYDSGGQLRLEYLVMEFLGITFFNTTHI